MDRSHRAAFTLVELLLALAAGSVVLLVGAALLGGAGERCGRMKGGIAARREFRFALGGWSADLATAVPRAGVFPVRGGAGPAGDRIGFFLLQAPARQSDGGRIGDLCGVTYYLKDLVEDGRPVRCLMRGMRESAEVFAALKSGGGEALFAPRDSDEPVAFGVVRFEARPEVRESTGVWREWHSGGADGPQAVAWRLEVVRPGRWDRLASPADWDALASGAGLLPEGEIEGQSGVTAFGHEGGR